MFLRQKHERQKTDKNCKTLCCFGAEVWISLPVTIRNSGKQSYLAKVAQFIGNNVNTLFSPISIKPSSKIGPLFGPRNLLSPPENFEYYQA